jgi:integrase
MGRGRPGAGVEALATSIRISFTLDGKRCRETLDLKPTPANMKYASRLVKDIKTRIGAGSFDYTEFFPNSKRKEQRARSALFNDFAAEWLALQVVEHSTRYSYETCFKFWSREFEGKRIHEITMDDVKRIINARVAHGIAPKTINSQMDPLRGLFKSAADSGLIATNPTEKIKRLKLQKAAPDPLSKDEATRVLEWMEMNALPAVAAWYTVAINTGLRPSEQRALKRSDIADGRIKIERAFVRNQMKRTKTCTVRYVDLTPRAREALDMMCESHTHEYVFPRPDGEPMRDWEVQELGGLHWAPCLDALGIRRRTPYHTRHTYATISLMGGVNPAYISRQLGHATTALLFTTYSRWIDGADEGRERNKAAAALDAKVVPLPTKLSKASTAA